VRCLNTTEGAMMHQDSVVVCITDNKEKTYREYDFRSNKSIPVTKCSTVMLPFDSEYKIYIKNNDKNHRILVEIDIDGTNVTGNGIIIDANSHVHLERFVDIARRFKFVTADADGVAEPDSPDNGKITITVNKENTYFQQVTPDWNKYSWMKSSDGTLNPYPTVTYSTDSGVLRSCSLNAGSSMGDMGATVEGGHSTQKFGSDSWEGNRDEGFIFEFTLRGRSETKGMSAEEVAEYEEYKRLQKKFAGK